MLICHSCLPASSLWDRELGKGLGEGRSFAALWEWLPSQLSVKLPLLNAPERAQRVVRGGALRAWPWKGLPPHKGLGAGWLSLSWAPASPCLHHMQEGGIRSRPAGVHSLQLWSPAAQPNVRQHLQPSALKRPQTLIRDRAACLPAQAPQDRTVSIPICKVLKCHRSSRA